MPAPPLWAVALVVYAVLVSATIYFTRATTRRALSAMAAGVAVAVVGLGVEVLCQSLGLWRYPGSDTGYGPPAIYPALVLMFAVLSLIGWRVLRRFGWRGEVIFLIVVAVVGTVRDYQIADRATEFIALTPGKATVIADLIAWSGLTAWAQIVMRLIAGPAKTDRLARAIEL